jgi:preprotein translocase subunit YajC
MPSFFAQIPVLFADNAAAGGAAVNPNPSVGLITYLPYLVIFGLWFYLILLRPQQKQESARRKMIEALKKNDKVLTSAGIYGTVVSVDSEQDRVVIRIDDDRNIKVVFSRSSIARVLETTDEKEKDKASKEKAAEIA